MRYKELRVIGWLGYGLSKRETTVLNGVNLPVKGPEFTEKPSK